jgi:copper homeostasis protein
MNLVWLITRLWKLLDDIIFKKNCLKITKEVCVDNLDNAVKAFNKGADRIEFCSNLNEDGLTPNFNDLKQIKSLVSIPIRVMIRPHSKSFEYNDNDIAKMKESIHLCKKENFDGVVLGCLNEHNELDIEKINYLAQIAKPLNVIVHKAIDLTNSPIESLKTLFELNIINGVLSSGGCQTAELGMSILKNMVDISPKDFEIISAGKITDQNINFLHEKIQGQYYHGRKIVGEL